MPTYPLIRRFPSCIAILALGACAPVGPNHEAPAMDLPASFSQGGIKWKRQSPDSLPTPRAWWKLYGDSTLNSLVERSLERNQEIAASAARLRQAREISASARSTFFPNVDLGPAIKRSKTRMPGSHGGTNVETSFKVPVDMSYEIDVWGKVRRQVEAATATEGAAQETLNALRLSIAGEVAQNYWALRAADADRAVLDRTLQIRHKAIELLTKRRDAGTLSGLDLARAQTEVATAEAARIQIDQTRAELVNALAVLSGAAATGSSIPYQPTLPNPPSIPGSVPSELLRQRPDIRAAERNVAAANAQIGVATAAFYPSINIGASSGLDSSKLGDLFQTSSLVWSIGTNVIAPITSHKWLNAQRNAAIAAHDAASADYRQTVLDAIREVENALQGTSILQRQEGAQQQALAAAQKTLDLSMKQFEAGMSSLLDLVDAERSQLDAERTTNSIRAERLAISVSLIKALGGEW